MSHDAQSRAIPDQDTEPTITVERAAAVLGISRRSAYNAAERGDIPAIRIGRRMVVPTGKFLAAFDLVDAAGVTP